MNTLFPMFVNLNNRLCTVVGGGKVALRKILVLLECQASVRVIAPTFIQRIVHLSHAKNIDLREQPYQKCDITDSFLVIAATNDAEVNKQIYQDCTALHILCNVVDHPNLCHFYVPAIYQCGNLKIAISTNGISPVLAKKIKADLSEMYPEEFLPYLKYLQKIRETVKLKIAEEAKRKEILEKIVYDSDFLRQCKNDRFCQETDHLDFINEVEKWS